jgi:hypothetical protein
VLNAGGGPLLEDEELQSCINVDYDPGTPADCTVKVFPQPNTRDANRFEVDFNMGDAGIIAVAGNSYATAAQLNIQPVYEDVSTHRVIVFDYTDGDDPKHDSGLFQVCGHAEVTRAVTFGFDDDAGTDTFTNYHNTVFQAETFKLDEKAPGGNHWFVPMTKSADHKLLGTSGNDGTWYEITAGDGIDIDTTTPGTIEISTDISESTITVLYEVRLTDADPPGLQVQYININVFSTGDIPGEDDWFDVIGWATNPCDEEA